MSEGINIRILIDKYMPEDSVLIVANKELGKSVKQQIEKSFKVINIKEETKP